MRINETISMADKNTMQAYIADIDIMSTLAYKGKWSASYATVKAELAKKQ